MTKKRVVDFLLALTGGAIALVGYFYIEDWYYWVVALGGGLLMLIFLILMVRDGRAGPEPPVRPADGMAHPPAGSLTEIVLLNEEDQALSSWTLYGKTGMVIGRDSGENQVNINLANSTYAGTVDVEHAVLNYSAGSWYVEDLNSKNGVSVQKGDKRKYKLAPGHPCLCPYCNMETDTKEKRETQRSDVEIEEELFREDIKPVCGWIVCIDGPRQGKDYQIVQGKNFVGRADDMDIQILGDNEISRRNHAVIVFDPKKKETVLLPGDANGIVYLNGNAVYAPATLNKYDEIELGKSKFLFVPFCGENFMWGGKTE